ncbi:MAG: hypothetical protein JNL88_10585 [Bacteroidia bacterium]|nr:hypothetical protein [Bacteroidia bacterium]
MTRLLLISALLLLSCMANAQKIYSEKAYRHYPHWIDLMEDTLSNYHEVEKAFQLYFSVHPLPREEDEIIGMRNATGEEKQHKESWLAKLFGTRRLPPENEMAFAVKRYRHWQLMTEPWIQEDGRILFPYERKKILDNVRP